MSGFDELVQLARDVRKDVLMACLVFPRTASLSEDLPAVTITQVCNSLCI
jgi:hypothetical protein